MMAVLSCKVPVLLYSNAGSLVLVALLLFVVGNAPTWGKGQGLRDGGGGVLLSWMAEVACP